MSYLMVGIFGSVCLFILICCLIDGIKKGFGLAHTVIQAVLATVLVLTTIISFTKYFGSL